MNEINPLIVSDHSAVAPDTTDLPPYHLAVGTDTLKSDNSAVAGVMNNETSPRPHDWREIVYDARFACY